MARFILLGGLGLAALGFAGRYIARKGPLVSQTVSEAMKTFNPINTGSKYYRGGFDPKMNRKEAALILGISPAANKIKVKEAFKKVMAVNHPDRGGSPYIASKINEAKDFLEKQSR